MRVEEVREPNPPVTGYTLHLSVEEAVTLGMLSYVNQTIQHGSANGYIDEGRGSVIGFCKTSIWGELPDDLRTQVLATLTRLRTNSGKRR